MGEEEKQVVTEGKLLAACSYIWIVAWIWILFSKRDNAFILFHAKQAIALSLIGVVGIIPFVGWLLLVVIMVVSLIGLIQAALGKYWKIPGINALTDKMTI